MHLRAKPQKGVFAWVIRKCSNNRPQKRKKAIRVTHQSESQQVASEMLLGRKTLYHGTSAGNARSIEQEGFKPSTGLGDASAHHNSQLFMDESKGKTHFTSIKSIATGFARFIGVNDLQDPQLDLDIATKKSHMTRKNPETKSQELESIMKEIQKAEFHLQSMIDDQKGKVLKMNVPYHMYDEMKVDLYLLEDIPPQ